MQLLAGASVAGGSVPRFEYLEPDSNVQCHVSLSRAKKDLHESLLKICLRLLTLQNV